MRTSLLGRQPVDQPEAHRNTLSSALENLKKAAEELRRQAATLS